MSNGDWELPRGRGWLLLRISKHSIQPFTGKGARIGHMQAFFKRQMLVQCQGLACFHSLTAPPTVCSYITPSPSAGPLPAFIGLFLVFSTLALHPADRCLSPNHPSAASSAIIVLFPSQCAFQGGHFRTETMKVGSFPWWSIKVDITSVKTGLCRIPRGGGGVTNFCGCHTKYEPHMNNSQKTGLSYRRNVVTWL